MKNSHYMNIIKKVSVYFVVLSLFILPLLASAQTPMNPPPKTVTPAPSSTNLKFPITNPFKCDGQQNCDLMSLIRALLNNVVMPIAGVGVVLFIIYAGFSFVVAQGKPAEVTKAKQMLLWGLIGAGILLGAAGISKVVENTVNQLIVP